MLSKIEQVVLPVPGEEFEFSEQCLDFLEKIFKYNPKDRPSSFDLLEHCFIYGIEIFIFPLTYSHQR